MNRLFLFCIGGTGSRVLKSLVFLMASGVPMNAREIIPIIIDPDDKNGDVELTLQLLNRYSFIRQRASSERSKFFKTAVRPLGQINPADSQTGNLSQGFKARLQQAALDGVTFANFIEYPTLDPATRALMQVLYSEKNNLNSDLSVGFKGNPHMGSVVLNRLKDSDDFKYFVSNLQADDRVFIVSSIFGGTGASGFPLVVKNIRQPDPIFLGKQALLKSVPMGAVSVLPYFGVKPDSNSAINKDTFVSKTKAALSHYGVDLGGINALYYIGDEILSDYDNHEGAKAQRNAAHFIELAAAMAVIDFMGMGDSEVQNESFKEFGIHAAENILKFNFTNLGIATKALIAKPLTQLFYSLKHWQHRLPEAVRAHTSVYINGSRSSNSVAINPAFLGSDFTNNNLWPFIKDFVEWLQQMAQNQRGFDPFNWTTGELQHMIQGVAQAQKGMMFKSDKWDYKDFDTALDRADPQTGGLTIEQKFLALYDMATDFLFEDRIRAGLGG